MEPKFVTNAHEDYDYWYVSTIYMLEKLSTDRHQWRVIRVDDMERFAHYQTPRYYSGLYVAYSVESTDGKEILNGRKRVWDESQEAQDLFKQIGE